MGYKSEDITTGQKYESVLEDITRIIEHFFRGISPRIYGTSVGIIVGHANTPAVNM